MVRDLKVVLVALVALWGALGTFGNLMHFSGVLDAVRSVVSMEGVPGEHPQATSNPAIIWLGALAIIIGKAAAAIFGAIGVAQMTVARRGDAKVFQHAKRFALVGCGAALAMLYGAFIVAADSFFMMWQGPSSAAGPGAFRYGGFIALIMIFVAQEEA